MTFLNKLLPVTCPPSPAKVSVKFTTIFYICFLLSPISIITTKLIYFSYFVVILYAAFYIFTVFPQYLAKILRQSFHMFTLFLIINLSLIWSIDPSRTILELTIYNSTIVFYIILSLTVIISSTMQRTTVFLCLPFLCFLINIYLILKFGVVRANDHAMKEMVNSYSNNMVVVMEACLPILFFRLRFKFNYYVVLAIILAIFNILISESRGGLMTLLLFIIILPFYHYRRKSNRFILFSSTIIALVVLISGFLYSGAYEKFEVLSRFNELTSINTIATTNAPSNLSLRLLMYHHGLKLMIAHPILGIGWGSFITSMEEIYGSGVIAHNLIIEIWSSCGVVGTAIFLLTLFTALKRLYHCHRNFLKLDESISYWCMANMVCLVLLCFHGLFRPFLSNIFLYFPFAEAFIFTRYQYEQLGYSNTSGCI